MNALTTVQPATGNGNALIPTSMDGAIRLAEMMARGRLVPQHLQQQPGDCLMVIEQAMRWGMSPFAVAQSTSVIQGKLMFEGKLVAAAVQSCGILDGRLSYDFTGEGDARAITVRGTIRGEAQPREITVRLKDAKTTNGMWTKQPDQQLVYHGTRAWARRHTPEVMLGVYSPEEMETAQPARDNFRGTTIDAALESAPTPPPEPKKLTTREWLDALETELTSAETADAVDAILSSERVQTALDKLTNGARTRLQTMLDEAVSRTATHEEQEPFPGDIPSEAS